MARLLKPKEIECRVQQINEKGLSLLLYVTSRTGQNLLDEMYGPTGWQREHQLIDGSLYCTISVWDEDKKTWVKKQDVGKESYAEKEKGRASDSFKRACVNWGIGRELYSAPFIWISEKQANIKQKGDRYVTYDEFFVKSITYNDLGEIDSLEIINQNLEVVYRKWPTKTIDKIKVGLIEKELDRTGIDKQVILDMCSVSDISKITEEDFPSVYNKLKASKSKDEVK